MTCCRLVLNLQEAVTRISVLLKEACEGLALFLRQLKDESQGSPLFDLLKGKMETMEEMDWLAPPMLSKR